MRQKIIPEEIKITGYIRELEKDKGGRVFAVFIETDNFQRYIVHSTITKELIHLINKKVIAHCEVVNTDVHYNDVIRIVDYKVVE